MNKNLIKFIYANIHEEAAYERKEKATVTVNSTGTGIVSAKQPSVNIGGSYTSSGNGADDANGFAGGKGTVASPWQVATPAQLERVGEYLDKHFILTSDIDLSGDANWTPIGSYISNDALAEDYSPHPVYAFTGSFDGGGYTISNLTITRDTLDERDMTGSGLFGAIGGSASIQNLTLENAVVTSTGNCAAALVGMAMSYNENAIKNITLTGTNTISGAGGVAGLVGSGQDTNIIDCSAQADVYMTAAGNGAGILGGGLEGGVITGCSVTGSVTATVTLEYGNIVVGAIGVGGLMGCAFESEEVSNCNVTDVTITVGQNAIMIGGLLGYSGMVNEGMLATDPEGFTLIKNCVAENVTIEAAPGVNRIGGIVGSGFCGSNYHSYYPASSAMHIIGCTASGEIKNADATAIVGSILGYAFRNSAIMSSDGSGMIGATHQVGAADAAQAISIGEL